MFETPKNYPQTTEIQRNYQDGSINKVIFKSLVTRGRRHPVEEIELSFHGNTTFFRADFEMGFKYGDMMVFSTVAEQNAMLQALQERLGNDESGKPRMQEIQLEEDSLSFSVADKRLVEPSLKLLLGLIEHEKLPETFSSAYGNMLERTI